MNNRGFHYFIDRALQHLIDKLNNPLKAYEDQLAYNKERFDFVFDIQRSRPVFLPVQIEMPAAVQTLPISGQTNELKYDVLIIGAISDGEDKKISLGFNDENTKPFVSTGESGTQITLEGIAGKSLESAGFNGVQPFQPFLLEANTTLNVDVYKPVATAGIEKVTICFLGLRVFSDAFVGDLFTKAVSENVLDEIAKRKSPQQRFDVCKIAFDADGRATAKTTKTGEPRIIWGFRTTTKNAMVTIGYEANESFSKDYFPIWALAAENGNNPNNYRFLKNPIFLAAGEQLYFGLKNTINGTINAVDGQIEVLATTV